MATWAPSRAKRRAMAAPMPREPPVTSATLSARGLDMLYSEGEWIAALAVELTARCDLQKEAVELRRQRFSGNDVRDHIDVAVHGFRIGAHLMRGMHDGFCHVVCNAGHAHINAGLDEVRAAGVAEIDCDVD